MNIGKRIKMLRKLKKMTSKQLADKSFISQSFLSDIENDKAKPSIDTLFSICNVLEISPAAFFSISVDVKEQLRSMDYISNETKLLIELINQLPDSEKMALINYLSERLKK